MRSLFRRSIEVLFVLLVVGCAVHATNDCVSRSYAGTEPRIVCVCNADACDDIEPVGTLANGEAAIYWSDVNGRRMDKVIKRFETTPLGAILDVDASVLHQEIIGFGGAFTDAATTNIDSLSTGAKKRLLEQYFGENGAAYTLGRIPMASNDFSNREYSYDDIPGDHGLEHFALAGEDRLHKIPIIKEAMSLVAGYNSSLRLFASPWSAPAWMKSNGAMVGGGKLRGFPSGPYYLAWAAYFVKFVEAYFAAGVPIWAVTPQNEPTSGIDPTWPWQTMYFTAENECEFIKGQLGPALRNSPVAKDVAIIMMDDQRYQLPTFVDAILNDEEANSFVTGVGVHWYGDRILPASILGMVHDKWPDKFVLGTEACNGWRPEYQGVHLGDFGGATDYAHSIIENLNNYVAGWTDWNLALNMQGGPTFVSNFVDSPIIVDAARDEFLKQPTFYAMAHFSRFLRPGDRRCEMTVPSIEPLEDVSATAAIVENGRRVIILLNRAQNETWTVSLRDRASPSSFLNLEMPPKSIATVVWNAPKL